MADINVTNEIIDVNVTEEVITVAVDSGAYPLPYPVYSVFGRTGAVVSANGDYTTSQVTEGSNLYYTDTRTRASLSFTAGSGAYNSTTGVITIPTNNNQITNGAGYITNADLTGYIPYTGATTAIDLNAKSVVNISHLGINTTSVPTILFRAVGDNNSNSRIAMRGYSSNTNSSSIRVTKFRGTAASPQAPLSGDSLGKFELAGYGTTSSDGYPQASFEGLATENWGATARGSKTVIKVTPNATINQVIALTINQDKSAVFESSVTGTSLIKTGGTSSQFLKADGSVDSSSYITLTSLSFAAGSGAYNSTTGVITIPTNTNQLTNGASFISLTGLSATTPLSYNNTTGAFSISQSNTSTNGFLSSTDWNTFNGKQAALSGTGFVKISGTTISYDNSTYLTTISGITAGGELSGTYANPSLVNSAVIGKVLTGVNITGGTISATDSILTAFGKAQNQINGLIGGSIYQGTWNASTNSPSLTSSVGTSGYYYIVSVAGSTNLNGITNWEIGDWAIFNGGVWQKVDNTDSVVSVNGFTGAVSLSTSNVGEGTNLYYTDARSRAAISLTTTGTSGASTYTSGVINIPQYQAALTNPVTGTGTTNTLSKFTGSSAIGNSNITDTGSLVTIASPLTLSGSVTSVGNLSNYSVTATAGSAISKKITSTLVAAANSDVLVGLDINPTFTNGAFNGVTNTLIRGTYNGTNQQALMRLLSPNQQVTGVGGGNAIGLGVSLTNNNEAEWVFDYAGNGSTSNSQAFGFYGSAAQFRIYANGNTTIGTSSTDSGYKLDVNGTARVVGAVTINGAFTINAGFTINAVSNVSNIFTNSSANTIVIVANSSLTDSQTRIEVNGSSVSGGSRINYRGNLQTFTSSISATEYMRIVATGNLLLGTTTDSGYKLDVSGTGRFTSSLQLSGGASIAPQFSIFSNNQTTNNVTLSQGFATTTDNIGYLYNRANADFVFGTNNTEKMRILANGNVGIGTSSPSSLLTLFDSSTPKISFQNSGAVRAAIQSDSNSLTLNSVTGNDIRFQCDSTERMRITSGGQVLIGQTTASGSTNGIYLRVGQESGMIVTSDIALQLSRLSTTGDIQSFYSDSTRVGTISVSSTNTSYNTSSSDFRLKKNISYWEENVLSHFNTISPKVFNFNFEQDGSVLTKGFIAQEMVDKFPEAYPINDKGFYSFNPSGMVVYLMKAIQEQQALITSLQEQINDLKNK